jgi:putative oxidoreductase
MSLRISLAILLLRIASASVFLYHGAAILFGTFSGPGPEQFAASHQLPLAVAFLIGLAQFWGGLAMLSGVLFRLGAACIVIVMLGAIITVHWPHGFSVAKGGAEFAFTELMIALALLLTGPGSISLGRWLPSTLRKW